MTSELSYSATAWDPILNEWERSMVAAHLSPATVELRRYHLRRLARETASLSPSDITAVVLVSWFASKPWARETARAARSSLRGFWRWAVENDVTYSDPTAALPLVRPSAASPRPAPSEAVRRALASTDSRVRLMARLANDLGLRRAEVAVIRPGADVVTDARGSSLIVHGKGSRLRVVPLPPDLASQLSACRTEYLFPSPTGGHLTPHWVGTLVSRALGEDASMHQLRHLCATEIHDRTRDVRLVQALLGHASLATTQRYIAVDNARMRDAVSARSRDWEHDRR